MDIERARFNMIEQQIRPWNVLDQDILDLLGALRREEFVPPAYRSMAFVDMEIPLTVDGTHTGEHMFAPKAEARLLQELGVRRHEQVLEIGAGSGYMAALLAHRARHVTTLERRPELARFAADNLRRAGVLNVTVETRNGADPKAAVGDAQFDAIVLSGSVAFVPDAWLQRLTVGGRLVAIVGQRPAMEAQVITRESATSFATRTLYETIADRLADFPEKEGFRF
jgi:protein-L-isoaspartate(D-aspartate) O-methyltransferase